MRSAATCNLSPLSGCERTKSGHRETDVDDPAATLSGVLCCSAKRVSQLYQNICLSRYDAVSSAAGGWPVNGAPPFSLPDAGDSIAVRLSAPGAVRHDVAHQVAHVVLQISDDVLDEVSNRDHAHDLARVQHW